MCGLCRRSSGMGFFTFVNRSQLELAKERHEPKAEHVKRSKPCCEHAYGPDHRPTVGTVKHCAQNFVFAEEAGKRGNSGDGNGGDGDNPERNRNQLAQAAHAAHVLLATHSMNYRTRT